MHVVLISETIELLSISMLFSSFPAASSSILYLESEFPFSNLSRRLRDVLSVDAVEIVNQESLRITPLVKMPQIGRKSLKTDEGRKRIRHSRYSWSWPVHMWPLCPDCWESKSPLNVSNTIADSWVELGMWGCLKDRGLSVECSWGESVTHNCGFFWHLPSVYHQHNSYRVFDLFIIKWPSGKGTSVTTWFSLTRESPRES